MARKKKAGCGPSMESGVGFCVVPATKKALEKTIEEVRTEKRYATTELISLSPQQFAGKAAAEKYLLENAEKWSDRYCPYVSIRNTDELKLPKIEDLRKKIVSEKLSLEKLKARTDAATFKSKLAGCPECESKVNRKYIKDSRCPVCGSSLRAPSAEKSIAKKEAGITKLDVKLRSECIKHASEAPLRYLVAVPADAVKGDKNDRKSRR